MENASKRIYTIVDYKRNLNSSEDEMFSIALFIIEETAKYDYELYYGSKEQKRLIQKLIISN